MAVAQRSQHARGGEAGEENRTDHHQCDAGPCRSVLNVPSTPGALSLDPPLGLSAQSTSRQRRMVLVSQRRGSAGRYGVSDGCVLRWVASAVAGRQRRGGSSTAPVRDGSAPEGCWLLTLLVVFAEECRVRRWGSALKARAASDEVRDLRCVRLNVRGVCGARCYRRSWRWC